MLSVGASRVKRGCLTVDELRLGMGQKKMGEIMSDNPNLAVQERFVAAALGGDTATLRELADPAMLLSQGEGMPYKGAYTGADGFLRFMGIFGDTLEIEKLAPVRVYETADPDFLVCEFELESRLKATGERYDTTMLEQWRFKGGKVVNIKPHYFDKPGAGAGA